jgi:hypothetical protein
MVGIGMVGVGMLGKEIFEIGLAPGLLGFAVLGSGPVSVETSGAASKQGREKVRASRECLRP